MFGDIQEAKLFSFSSSMKKKKAYKTIVKDISEQSNLSDFNINILNMGKDQFLVLLTKRVYDD